MPGGGGQRTTSTPATGKIPNHHHQMPKERHTLLSPNTLFLLTTIFSALIHHVSTDDGAVMAKLAKALIPSPAGWTGPAFCKWPGVSCDTTNKVSSINLASKSLTGILPPEINQLSNLKLLSLQRNRLSGPLPHLSKLESLRDVNLDENGFNSVPPGFLSGLTSLQSISINNNSNLPPWKLPDTLKDSTSLTRIIASKANIVGQIPDIFGSLPNFQSLRLSYNNLTGPLPLSFAKSEIKNLWLNNQLNGLSGTIDVLESMTSLKVVWLHANQFTGRIPDLSGCTELSDLMLRDNLLTGVIPDSLTTLPKLQNVALQSNSFQGPMPSFRPNVLVNLGTENHFCLPTPGPCDPQVTVLLEIAGAMNYPMELAESWEGNDACKQWAFVTCEKGSVAVVNFAKQGWEGTISPAYAKLTNLQSLFLNDNKLVGTIPQSLTTLKQLQILDLSNNNISGKIPEFSPPVTVKLSSNPFIGKDVPIIYPGGRSSGSPPSKNAANDGKESSSISTWVIVLLVLVLTIVFAVLGFFIYRHFVKKKDNGHQWFFTKGSGKPISSNIYEGNSNSESGGLTLKKVSGSDYHVYEGGNISIDIEVLRQATDNFSENSIVGKGGFGVVHRGQLPDGTAIAVKRMESCAVSSKGLNEFKAEIEVLTTVRHRNLVSLLGFCNNGGERLLVYEYMPKGCLGQHLFGSKRNESPPLTWNQRVNIALDVARGVEYLHSMAQQSFIHRDLKPSNILLGNDMRAKVSDFGLVRPAPDGNYSVETRLAGTFGYLAPEYAATGRVTRKVDVYAFGVVLTELVTGRKSLDGSLPEESSNLVAWFRPFLQDKNELKNAVDPVLLSAMDDETFQCIWKMAELAGHCTNREPNQRPDMSHAVNVLSSLVEQWTPAPNEEDSFNLGYNMSLGQVLQKWKDNGDESSTMSTDYFNHNTSNYGTSSTSISGKHL